MPYLVLTYMHPFLATTVVMSRTHTCFAFVRARTHTCHLDHKKGLWEAYIADGCTRSDELKLRQPGDYCNCLMKLTVGALCVSLVLLGVGWVTLFSCLFVCSNFFQFYFLFSLAYSFFVSLFFFFAIIFSTCGLCGVCGLRDVCVMLVVLVVHVVCVICVVCVSCWWCLMWVLCSACGV